MASAWDRSSRSEQRRQQNVGLRQTILQMAVGHVPYVRARLAAAGIDARLFKGVDALPSLPLSMRRDVLDPNRNPEGPRALVLRGTAEGVKRFSDRATLRKAFIARVVGGEEVHELAIEAATRAIHIHLAEGPGGRLPVAYTRDDLELLARAGARLAAVVGLEREDRLLNLVPFGPVLDFWGIYYMAHGVGMSAVHARASGVTLAAALSAFDDARATAVALPADEATAFPAMAHERSVDLSALRTLIAVGRSLTTTERAALGEALLAAGAREASIAAAYGPSEGRVLWGECAVPAGRTETFGFHTYPDMSLLEIVSPESGEVLAERDAGEVVVTDLAFRGGGAPRWRTGDLALGGLTTDPCPNCARTVPRVGPSIQRGAWLRAATIGGKRRVLDLRAAGAAAAERARDWQVELQRTDGDDRLTIYLAAGDQPGPLIELYEDLNRLRMPVSQVVLADASHLERRLRTAPGPWRRYWERTGDGVFLEPLAAAEPEDQTPSFFADPQVGAL